VTSYCVFYFRPSRLFISCLESTLFIRFYTFWFVSWGGPRDQLRSRADILYRVNILVVERRGVAALLIPTICKLVAPLSLREAASVTLAVAVRMRTEEEHSRQYTVSLTINLLKPSGNFTYHQV
jgi:hypothetical protein